ncbi:hypothetical protein [Pseudomonas syringae group sp. 247E2]|uniref:phosphorylase family protein n=1 Tax=Pseudomonas syringae group sp. 247E2 TaxID=3079592 RepID=UPI0029074DC5|nr:hypothetical protein [Pseudomonas syringae group sp. 247E2]MDU8607614.1 hypothetical protein [Pseudomonas syringae group sp. 247E2]
MIKILVIDDEISKLQEIAAICDDTSQNISITHVATAVAARKAVRSDKYDMLVIDLNLPDGLRDKPQIEGGLDLLDLLITDVNCRLPPDILFITAREDDIEAARKRSAEKGAVLWQFGQRDKWKTYLKGRLTYLVTRLSRILDGYPVDIAFVTALQSPELDAILALDYSWKTKIFSGDPSTYHFGSFLKGEDTIQVVAVCAPRKGMPSAASLSAKIVSLFKPKLLIMTGICAGIASRTNFGDVIVADPAWDYGSGKRALDSNRSPVFQAAAYQMSIDPNIRQAISELSRNPATTQSIRSGWQGNFPQGVLNIKLAPMASGASVIADDAEARNVTLQHRELAAIEMEGYAVMAAVESAATPKPLAIVIKSVCDYADADKNDDWQSYAAYTSAAFADLLVRSPSLEMA